MQKKFLQNIGLLLAVNLLIKPFWILGIDRAVQGVVGTEEYGLFFAIFNFSFLLNIFLDFGITNFNNKNIAQNNHLINKHFSSIMVLKLMLGVFYMVFTMGAGFLIGYRGHILWLLFVMGINQFLAFMLMYLRSNLAGLHLFKTDAVVSVLDRSLMILFCGLLLWTNVFGDIFSIDLYIYLQTLAYIITVLIAFVLVMKKAKFVKLKWHWPFFVLILKKSFPFAVLVLLMTFYGRFDTVMLERLLPKGAEQSGIYAAAFRLLDAANMMSYLFAGMLLPIFARMIKYSEPVEQLVKLSFTILIIPACVVAVGCMFYAHEIMGLLYKEHVTEAAEVFGVLMWCFVPASLTYIFGTLLTANGSLKVLNIMALSGMLFNLIFNFILIPKFEARGAAIASLSTQGITALIQIFLAYKLFKFRFNTKLLIRMAVFLPSISLLAWMSKSISSPYSGEYVWIIQLGMYTFAAGALAFAIRLMRLKSIYRILKYG